MSPPLEAINLNLLLALEALLSERSVTRAARRMGISQPAMSHSLAELRTIFHDELLVRVKGEMQPSALGAHLGPKIRDGLQLLRQSLSETPGFDPPSARGSFTLATGDFLMVRLARELSLTLAKAAPHIELRLQLFRPAELAELLLNQQVDLVVGPTVATEGGVCSEALSSEPFAFAMREGHPLLRGRRKTGTSSLEDFLAWPHLLISPSGRGESAVDTALRVQGVQRRVAVRVSSFLAAAEIVATTDLLLTAPRSSLEGQGARIVIRPLPFSLPPIELRCYWEARRDREPRLLWLREAVMRTMATRKQSAIV